jgi:hypothetical protein
MIYFLYWYRSAKYWHSSWMTFANSIEHDEMYFSSWMTFANSIEHDEMYKYNSAIKGSKHNKRLHYIISLEIIKR